MHIQLTYVCPHYINLKIIYIHLINKICINIWECYFKLNFIRYYFFRKHCTQTLDLIIVVLKLTIESNNDMCMSKTIIFSLFFFFPFFCFRISWLGTQLRTIMIVFRVSFENYNLNISLSVRNQVFERSVLCLKTLQTGLVCFHA